MKIKHKTRDRIKYRAKLLSLGKARSFISESFSTIAGYKENAAIVHYSAAKESNTAYNLKVLS